MSKPFRALLVSIFLLTLITCAPAVTPTDAPTIAPTLAPTRAAPVAASDFDASRAFDHVKMLAVTIGSRVAGSESGGRAGDYIAQQFSSFGYTVEKQPFPFEAWEDLGTQVQITAPDAREIQARPLQYSPAGHAEAELVAVGGVGSESDFAQANLTGKIALVKRGDIPFSDKAKNAASAGAVAILIYNNAPGGYGGTLRDRVSIPTLAITAQDGQSLLDALSNGAVKVKLDSNTRIDQKTGYNIIGTKRGTSDKGIVLGGHYDSVAAGPGANDNGSGTGVLLELARVLAQKNYKDTLTFIAFDGEEFGLLGSQYYVEHLSSTDRAKIRAMLNFDMLAGGSSALLLGGDGAVGRIALNAAQELGIDALSFRLGNNAGSDHQSFTRFNIDAVMFSRDYNLLHTPQDVIGEVHADWLGESGRVALQVMAELEK